jgi:hypothetical protein
MNIIHNTGPKAKPCGTPLITSVLREQRPFKITRCFLFYKEGHKCNLAIDNKYEFKGQKIMDVETIGFVQSHPFRPSTIKVGSSSTDTIVFYIHNYIYIYRPYGIEFWSFSFTNY